MTFVALSVGFWRLSEAFTHRARRRRSLSSFFSSQLHTVTTRQPCAVSSLRTLRSRAQLRRNFSSQNSVRVAGIVAPRQPLWRCQKQPCTKTTVRCLGNTTSGFPTILRPVFSRKRKPNECNIRRTSTSGFVPEERMRLMFQLRCSDVRRSTISRLELPFVANLQRERKIATLPCRFRTQRVAGCHGWCLKKCVMKQQFCKIVIFIEVIAPYLAVPFDD